MTSPTRCIGYATFEQINWLQVLSFTLAMFTHPFQKCFDEIQRKSLEDETVTSDYELDMSDGENQPAVDPENAPQENRPYDYTKSIEFGELLAELRYNLVAAIKLQLRNSSALVRRAVILLLEFTSTTTLKIDNLLQSCVRPTSHLKNTVG